MTQTTQQQLRWWALGVAIITMGSLAAAAETRTDDLAVADGRMVTVEVTLSLPDKTVVSSTKGQEPVTYVQGQHQIVPGLEKALAGMKAGQEKHIELAAAQAFGPYDDAARVTVKKSQVPDDVKVGTMLSSPDGHTAKVIEVSGDSVVLDTNHPLAGKDLVFDVKVVRVEKSAPAPASDK